MMAAESESAKVIMVHTIMVYLNLNAGVIYLFSQIMSVGSLASYNSISLPNNLWK